MDLALQFIGAIGILLPFALLQIGRLSQHSYAYLALNLDGSAVLTTVAYLDGQWGFSSCRRCGHSLRLAACGLRHRAKPEIDLGQTNLTRARAAVVRGRFDRSPCSRGAADLSARLLPPSGPAGNGRCASDEVVPMSSYRIPVVIEFLGVA
ncbi:hypothetical protein [Allobranchiibius sp. GilTou73]|uniref:CBU_0592 family membrane protein n=1 Tax=Allobranchiibius sp. GilTou73 TaxID=2904523 RepID=UPI001F3422CC|nr:hypothetical protein [Allobranchiibius sp. GilTou73]UIJ33757.1 hypothetical protein LVQ62_11405 [Allobranchiibius sp. GilTou73]